MSSSHTVGQRPWWPRSDALLLCLVVGAVLRAGWTEAVVARCPEAGDQQPYCQCGNNTTRSGRAIIITCDFQIKGIKEAVLLTEAVFPSRRWGVVSTYVRIMNAGSLQVTGGFLREWLMAPSAALDIWHSGTVTLEAAPPRPDFRALASFSTFAGIGIIGCSLPEIPARLLRDRLAAGLRLKKTAVGVLRQGLLHNVRQVRYLVLEDSVVDSVEGSVAREGYLRLGQRGGHSWGGLVITNTTIRTVAAGAFNLTHQGKQSDNVCKAEVTNCQMGTVGTGALTVAGDIAVTIKGNYFQRLEREAFKIDVKDELKFEENVALSLDVSALEGLICHNFTSLEKNTAHLDTMPDNPNNSAIPFHVSCGNPQVFMVVSRVQPQRVSVTSKATWVLLALVLLVAAAALLHLHNLRQKKCEYRKGNTFHFFNGLKSSQENLSSRPELNMMTEVSAEGLNMMTEVSAEGLNRMTEESAEGVSNPLYDRTGPSSSL